MTLIGAVVLIRSASADNEKEENERFSGMMVAGASRGTAAYPDEA
jgi:hypothetical protein